MNEDEVTLVTSFLFDRSQEDCGFASRGLKLKNHRHEVAGLFIPHPYRHYGRTLNELKNRLA